MDIKQICQSRINVFWIESRQNIFFKSNIVVRVLTSSSKFQSLNIKGEIFASFLFHLFYCHNFILESYHFLVHNFFPSFYRTHFLNEYKIRFVTHSCNLNGILISDCMMNKKNYFHSGIESLGRE